MSIPEPIQRILKNTDLVRELKLKKTEFQGLGNELSISQKELMGKYTKSKGIQHTRDLGTHREEILREHLLESNLIPPKFRISQVSCRVADTNGNYSRELDIVFSNYEESILLMKRGKTLEVHPIENTYGTIQVKSKLTLKELESAFENIASYKKLRKHLTDHKTEYSNEGFGIIFAYTTDFDHSELTTHINTLKDKYSSDLLPNVIIILDHGHFSLSYQSNSLLLTDDISKYNQNDIIYLCNPNHNDHLFYFHNILLHLLRKTRISLTNLGEYYNIGTIDFNTNISFKFFYGEFFELASCNKHSKESKYLRKISSTNLEKIYQHIATNVYFDEFEVVLDKKSSSLVKIYNPENLDLKSLLIYENGSLAYEKIIINKLGNKFDVLLPHYYIVKEKLFEDCPNCIRNKKQQLNRESSKIKNSI